MNGPLNAAQIYEQVNGGPGTGHLIAAQEGSANLTAGLSERAQQIANLASRIQAGWTGEAGANAANAALPLAKASLEDASLLAKAGTALEDQTSAFGTVKNTVVPVEAGKPELTSADVFDAVTTGNWNSYNNKVGEWQAKAQQNIDAFAGYHATSVGNGDTMPSSFTPLVDPGAPIGMAEANAQQFEKGTATPNVVGGGQPNTSAGNGFQPHTPVTQPQYDGTKAAAAHEQPVKTPPMTTPSGGTPNPQGGGGQWGPSTGLPQPGGPGNGGFKSSGPKASGPGGFKPGGPGLNGVPGGPNSGGKPGGLNPGGPGTGNGRMTPGGPGAVNGRPGGMSPGSPGTGNGRPGGMTPGGPLAGGNPPGRTVGGVPGGTPNPAAPVRGGESTAPKPGFGPTGAAGAQRGEEDKEHRRPGYLLGPDPDKLFGGDTEKPTPPVIGETRKPT